MLVHRLFRLILLFLLELFRHCRLILLLRLDLFGNRFGHWLGRRLGNQMRLHAILRNRPAHRHQLLAGALIAEFGDPTLQTRVRSRIGNDIRTEFRILVRDFRQEHGIGVRILHGRHRGIEIDHHDLLVSWSVTILLNDS